METPLVSVVIPSYNYANFIAETIASLQQQVYENWEAIIVDDGSADATAEVAAGLADGDKRVQYFFQENQGLPAARNTGLRQCKGKYIQFLDADDLLSPQKLAIQVAFMEGHPEIGISYTAARYFKTGHVSELFRNIHLDQSEWMPELSGEGMEILRSLLRHNIMPVNSALFRAEILKTVGFQNEAMKSLEDWEYWIRCAMAGVAFSYIDHTDAYALIRVHAVSMSQNRMGMYKWEVYLREQIVQWLANSTLPGEQQRKINEINRKGLRKVLQKMLAANLGNKNVIRALYLSFGPLGFLKTWLGALNEARKR